MSLEWAQVIIVPMFGVLATLVVGRYGKHGDRENQLIDQLQEDRDADRRDLADLRAQLGDLGKRVELLERENLTLRNRDAMWTWHAVRLETQITDLGETPLPRPTELSAVIPNEPGV